MRKLLALVAAVAMSAILAIPASAQGGPPCSPVPNGNGAVTCTVQMRDVPFGPFAVMGFTCPDGRTVPGGVVAGTYETAIFHITINTAGDVWATNTIEGTFTLNADTGVTYTGHLEGWFGESMNNQNFVFHDNFNVTATGSDGSTVSFHMVMHLSVSASGIVVTFANLTC